MVNREMADSPTGELLRSVLEILKSVRRFDSYEARDLPKGHTTRFRAFVPRFKAATFLIEEGLSELDKIDAVDNAVEALHKTARCLDTIAGPTGGSLQSNLFQVGSYTNLHSVLRLPCTKNCPNPVARYIYERLALNEKSRETHLQELKSCGDNLEIILGNTQLEEDYIEANSEHLEGLNETWAGVSHAHDAFLGCACDTIHVQRFYELRLHISTELGRKTNHNKHALNILMTDEQAHCSYEVHFDVSKDSGSQRRVRFVETNSTNSHQLLLSPQRDMYNCFCKTVHANPDACIFRWNLALQDSHLWCLPYSKREYSSSIFDHQITLRDLLQSSSAGWTLMTKLVLAVVLAQSLPYIYDGPWLGGHWNRSKIVFHKEGNFIPVRPFLRTPTHKNAIETAKNETFHRFPGILDFGVALLEIYLGQRIDNAQNSTNNLWAIASRVLEEQKYNMNSSYRSAVKACLLPDFGTGRDCSPQNFRELIFSQIVSPLQKELATFIQDITEASSLSEFTSRIDLVSGQFHHTAHITEHPQPGRNSKSGLNSSEPGMGNHFRSSRTHSNQTTISDISNNSYSHSSYTVAIICPMGIEMTPVLAILDKEHPDLPSARYRNKYILGEIGEHRVVVTVMPEIGNNSAAAMVTQLQNDFAELRFGLLVGIGGGIPDPNKHDIRLGDIVVGQPVLNFGGVVQFDRGKMGTDNHFQRTGHLNKPPVLLLSSLETLKARHKQNGNRISDYLTEMHRKSPNMIQEQYIYQGQENDILFHQSYHHKSGDDCRECKRDMVIERKSRESTSPKVHYGTIGSANIVVKDAKMREELKRDLGIICVEMEAAGLMDEFPCLVIRGISDYADSHKAKRWQPYAAATAAAFAKELLTIVPP